MRLIGDWTKFSYFARRKIGNLKKKGVVYKAVDCQLDNILELFARFIG